ENGLATEMMRFDLVTHRRALLPAPRRALRAGARAACAPSGASLSRAPPWAVGATPVSGCPVETDRAVKDDEGGPSVASASPSSAKEGGRASNTAPAAVPEASRIRTFSRSRAAQPTLGDSAYAMPQHVARSNIHSGTSTQRATPCAVSAH